MPTRELLDVATEHPVMFDASYTVVVNSFALKKCGITRATPDPAGGEIARDTSGEPTGLLFERALSGVEVASREGWEARFVEVARAAWQLDLKPADLAGVQSGDIILAVGGEGVRSQAEFYRKVWGRGAAGSEIPLRVLQGIDVREIKVRSIDRMDYFRQKPTF